MNTTYISESEITKHLPEYILKSSDSDERFVITKDNKPIAALISIEDFQFIEQKQKGLASVVGKWKDFDEIEDILADELIIPASASTKNYLTNHEYTAHNFISDSSCSPDSLQGGL